MNSKVYANNRLLKGLAMMITVLIGLAGLLVVSLLMLFK